MSESDSPNAERKPPQSIEEVGAGAPIPAICRAQLISVGHRSAWCLVEGGPRCKFSEPFANGFLCCHPQRERIILRTLVDHASPRPP